MAFDIKQWAGPSSELGRRVASGLVLAIVAIGALWAGGWVFAGLAAMAGVAVAWEWSAMVRRVSLDAVLIVQVAGILIAVVLAVAGLPALSLVTIAIAAILSLLLEFGSRGHMAALGVLYAGLPVVALTWIRGADAAGFRAALLLVLVVVATDTGAYFTGRALGGPKLMPSVSPGKTWSGLIGGAALAMLVAGAFGVLVLGVYSARLMVVGAILAVVSQIGDLVESALKRAHGVKDSSAIIPGHGGVMDRIDGLIMASLAVAVYAMATNLHAPARALLGGG